MTPEAATLISEAVNGAAWILVIWFVVGSALR